MMTLTSIERCYVLLFLNEAEWTVGAYFQIRNPGALSIPSVLYLTKLQLINLAQDVLAKSVEYVTL
jgi:hypothetical protein